MVDSTKIQHRCIPVSQAHRSFFQGIGLHMHTVGTGWTRKIRLQTDWHRKHFLLALSMFTLLGQSECFFPKILSFKFRNVLFSIILCYLKSFEKIIVKPSPTNPLKKLQLLTGLPPSTLDPPPCPVARSARFHLKAVDSPCFGSVSTTLMKKSSSFRILTKNNTMLFLVVVCFDWCNFFADRVPNLQYRLVDGNRKIDRLKMYFVLKMGNVFLLCKFPSGELFGKLASSWKSPSNCRLILRWCSCWITRAYYLLLPLP